MRVLWLTVPLLTLAGSALVIGCGHEEEGPGQSDAMVFTSDAGALLAPEACGPCHADHLKQWSGSMHAYASRDPIFLAMNRRMQREQPTLGTFCVKCHAPMAVLAGKTTNGLNLSELDSRFLGVTCFFCHSIESVDTAHPFNAAVTLANDGVMRGEIKDPVPNGAHGSKASPFQDQSRPESAAMCGGCHDIMAPAGGHIETTFAEWRDSPFSGADAGPGASGAGQVSTCASGCHMVQDPQPRVIAVGSTPDGGPLPPRFFHEHDFPAVDQALTPFPNAQDEHAAVLAKLTGAVQEALCVSQAGGIRVILDTVNLGHKFPSGATQDRRLWAEVKAFDQAGSILYQSGVVPNGISPVDVGPNDPDMWLMRDCMFDAQGDRVDMFWQGATTDGNELPPIAAFFPNQAAFLSHKVRFFPKSGAPVTDDSGAPQMPASVTLRLRLQPIGIDVLNNLVSTGDLDAGLVAALPPPIDIPLGAGDQPSTVLTWSQGAAADGGVMPFADPEQGLVTCVGSLTNPASQNPAFTHKNPKCSP